MSIVSDLDARVNEYNRCTDDTNRNAWLKPTADSVSRSTKPGSRARVIAFLLRRTSEARNPEGVSAKAVASA